MARGPRGGRAAIRVVVELARARHVLRELPRRLLELAVALHCPSRLAHPKIVGALDHERPEVLSAGATLASKPHDVGGGTRIATVTDADGNTLGLITRS